jgi:hypothetical protein
MLDSKVRSRARGHDMATRERELVDTGRSKQYVRRDAKGRFTTEQSEVGRSATADRRQHTDTPSPRGQGDRGNRPKAR